MSYDVKFVLESIAVVFKIKEYLVAYCDAQ